MRRDDMPVGYPVNLLKDKRNELQSELSAVERVTRSLEQLLIEIEGKKGRLIVKIEQIDHVFKLLGI